MIRDMFWVLHRRSNLEINTIYKEYNLSPKIDSILISNNDVINSKNSFSRKKIEQDILVELKNYISDYVNKFNIELNQDNGFYLFYVNTNKLISLTNDYFKLVYIVCIKGKLQLSINKKKIKLKPKDIFIYPSNFTHCSSILSLEDNSSFLATWLV